MALIQTKSLAAELDVLPVSQALGFPVRYLGRSQARIAPQRIGPWWMQPVGDVTSLPQQAQRRLLRVAEFGIPIKSVVVFYEISSLQTEHLTTRPHAVSVTTRSRKAWLLTYRLRVQRDTCPRCAGMSVNKWLLAGRRPPKSLQTRAS